jgi:hypothetical protein
MKGSCTEVVISFLLLSRSRGEKHDQSTHLVGASRSACTEVEVIKLNSAKIYRFLQLLSHIRGFFC